MADIYDAMRNNSFPHSIRVVIGCVPVKALKTTGTRTAFKKYLLIYTAPDCPAKILDKRCCPCYSNRTVVS